MAERNAVKCRFCDWTTLRFRRWKGGKRTSGPEVAYQRLLDHIEWEHPVEWKEVSRYLDTLWEEAEEVESLPTFS